jgi:hypothetical protein
MLPSKKMRKYFSLQKEAAEPQVGIFWLYKGQILQFTQPVSAIPPVGGFKDSNYNHDAYWGQMTKMFPELAAKEYYDIPRGRVLFQVNGTYIIMLPSKEATNRMVVSRIIKNFNLPAAKSVAKADHHYDPSSMIQKEFDDDDLE